MNPSEIKEIILQVNGKQAEEEIKKFKGIIEGTRRARKQFKRNHQDSTKWTKAQRIYRIYHAKTCFSYKKCVNLQSSNDMI